MASGSAAVACYLQYYAPFQKVSTESSICFLLFILSWICHTSCFVYSHTYDCASSLAVWMLYRECPSLGRDFCKDQTYLRMNRRRILKLYLTFSDSMTGQLNTHKILNTWLLATSNNIQVRYNYSYSIALRKMLKLSYEPSKFYLL